MEAVVLVVHLIVAVSIVIVVLVQRSEGGGLGIGGSGGGLGNFASQRTTADTLTRLTTMLGAAFMVTSLALAILASQNSSKSSGSILDIEAPGAPVGAPVDVKDKADEAAVPAPAGDAMEKAEDVVKEKAADVAEDVPAPADDSSTGSDDTPPAP